MNIESGISSQILNDLTAGAKFPSIRRFIVKDYSRVIQFFLKELSIGSLTREETPQLQDENISKYEHRVQPYLPSLTNILKPRALGRLILF